MCPFFILLFTITSELSSEEIHFITSIIIKIISTCLKTFKGQCFRTGTFIKRLKSYCFYCLYLSDKKWAIEVVFKFTQADN